LDDDIVLEDDMEDVSFVFTRGAGGSKVKAPKDKVRWITSKTGKEWPTAFWTLHDRPWGPISESNALAAMRAKPGQAKIFACTFGRVVTEEKKSLIAQAVKFLLDKDESYIVTVDLIHKQSPWLLVTLPSREDATLVLNKTKKAPLYNKDKCQAVLFRTIKRLPYLEKYLDVSNVAEPLREEVRKKVAEHYKDMGVTVSIVEIPVLKGLTPSSNLRLKVGKFTDANVLERVDIFKVKIGLRKGETAKFTVTDRLDSCGVCHSDGHNQESCPWHNAEKSQIVKINLALGEIGRKAKGDKPEASTSDPNKSKKVKWDRKKPSAS